MVDGGSLHKQSGAKNPTPLKFSRCWKIPKASQIIENTRAIANTMFILLNYSVKVSKIQAELGGVSKTLQAPRRLTSPPQSIKHKQHRS
jgi:hypothetical protein